MAKHEDIYKNNNFGYVAACRKVLGLNRTYEGTSWCNVKRAYKHTTAVS